jgi:hypothetical protein
MEKRRGPDRLPELLQEEDLDIVLMLILVHLPKVLILPTIWGIPEKGYHQRRGLLAGGR